MISVALMCGGQSVTNGVRCPVLTDNVPVADVEAWYERQLAEHGWTMHDGRPYCPRHNPTKAGAIVDLTDQEYVPIGDSGWEARLPTGGPSWAKVEVRQRRDGAP